MNQPTIDRELMLMWLLAIRLYSHLKRIRAQYVFLDVDSPIMTACDDLNLALYARDKQVLGCALMKAGKVIALDRALQVRDREHARQEAA